MNLIDFEEYHAANPHVYKMFEKFTLEAIGSGKKHFGIDMIAGRLRWYSSIETVGDHFKINNNYKAFYARLFEKKNPQYKNFFRKRASIADDILKVIV